MKLTRLLLSVVLAMGLVAGAKATPKTKEEPTYAVQATCETFDRTPAAVVLIDLTADNEQCAVAAAQAEVRVYLVMSTTATRTLRKNKETWAVTASTTGQLPAVVHLVPGKVLIVGPASDARDVGELATIVVRTTAREASDWESRDITPSDISPNESMPLVAKRYGWRLH